MKYRGRTERYLDIYSFPQSASSSSDIFLTGEVKFPFVVRFVSQEVPDGHRFHLVSFSMLFPPAMSSALTCHVVYNTISPSMESPSRTGCQRCIRI